MRPLPRKKFIAANWKMHHVASEVRDYIHILSAETLNANDVDIVIIPSFTSLPKASRVLENNFRIKLGAQNMHFEDRGAFTGEISGGMLRDLFVRYILIGHSERRSLFKETDNIVAAKIAAAHRSELLPILCIGETLEEHQTGKTEKILEKQLTSAFEHTTLEDLKETIIAYEPVWAIGTGERATTEQIITTHHFIRNILEKISSWQLAQKTRIIYGGSVKPNNAHEILQADDIDGALVGGASLDPRDFAKIILSTSSEMF